MAEDRRRLLIRAIAAQPSPLQVSIRQSTGANCALCVEVIAPGTRQYEIGVGGATVIVDEKCYKSSLQGIMEANLPIADA